MAFFPHSFITHHPTSSSPRHDNSGTSFHPLFRLLDDFDQYTRCTNENSPANNTTHHQRSSIMKSFTPKFDVKETADTYELHGEVPGIEQQDIEIEFVDAETLTIKGRVERSYTTGTDTPDVTETPATSSSKTATIKNNAHQPTVEDEENATTESNPDQVSGVTAKKEDNSGKNQEEHSKDKLWINERSVGEFARSFTFPVRVDREAVKASMRNGVLSIVIPKSKKVEYKKITIT